MFAPGEGGDFTQGKGTWSLLPSAQSRPGVARLGKGTGLCVGMGGARLLVGGVEFGGRVVCMGHWFWGDGASGEHEQKPAGLCVALEPQSIAGEPDWQMHDFSSPLGGISLSGPCVNNLLVTCRGRALAASPEGFIYLEMCVTQRWRRPGHRSQLLCKYARILPIRPSTGADFHFSQWVLHPCSAPRPRPDSPSSWPRSASSCSHSTPYPEAPRHSPSTSCQLPNS